MEPSEHTPQQVSYHDVVLVLTPTVVRMEVDILLTKPMYLKEVMEHAHHCIGPLAHVNCLINEVVDLAWYGFTAHQRWHISLGLGSTLDLAGGGRWCRIPAGPCQMSSVL